MTIGGMIVDIARDECKEEPEETFRPRSTGSWIDDSCMRLCFPGFVDSVSSTYVEDEEERDPKVESGIKEEGRSNMS